MILPPLPSLFNELSPKAFTFFLKLLDSYKSSWIGVNTLSECAKCSGVHPKRALFIVVSFTHLLISAVKREDSSPQQLTQSDRDSGGEGGVGGVRRRTEDDCEGVSMLNPASE